MYLNDKDVFSFTVLYSDGCIAEYNNTVFLDYNEFLSNIDYINELDGAKPAELNYYYSKTLTEYEINEFERLFIEPVVGIENELCAGILRKGDVILMHSGEKHIISDIFNFNIFINNYKLEKLLDEF